MKRLSAALGLAFALALAFSQPAMADGIDRTYVVGDDPFPMTIDPADGRVYVGKGGGPAVVVIDPASGQVNEYRTTRGATFLALDSPHRRLYVSNSGGPVEVFDVTTMSIEATVPVGGTGIAVDPVTRRVYVAGASGLAVIDGATNTVIDSKPALDGHSWVAVGHDPSLHRLYIANIFEAPPVHRSIVVLDDRDLSLLHEIQIPLFVRWALAVDQVRHRVYVGDSSDLSQSTILAFDGATYAQVASVVVPGFAGGFAIAPNVVYVTAIEQGYHLLDPETLAIRQTVSTLPLRPLLAALHPDGSLYVGGRDYSGPDVVAAISSGNHAPVIQGASLSTNAPRTSDAVSYSVSAIDGDFPDVPGGQRDAVTLTYEWARNGVVIPGETTAALDLSRQGAGDRGDAITVRVTVSDPEGLKTDASESVIVVNAAPTLNLSLDNTSPGTNELLTAFVTASDADGDPVTVTHEWFRNGARLLGQRSATLDLGEHGNRGDVMTVVVTASDDHAAVTESVSSVTVIDTPPTLVVTVTNASPTTNEILRATAVGTDADGDPIAYWWDFLVNGVIVTSVIPDQNMSFDLGRPGWGDRDDTITVRVRPVANSLFGAAASASAVVVNAAPSVVVGLSDETPTTKSVLTATALALDDDGDELRYTYVWRVNGVIRRTTSNTSATTDGFNLAARGLVRQGDVVVCEITVTDGFASGSGIAQALVTNNKH